MRALRGGDAQAATKSSLADIEKRKKGKFFCLKSWELSKMPEFFECKIASCREQTKF